MPEQPPYNVSPVLAAWIAKKVLLTALILGRGTKGIKMKVISGNNEEAPAGIILWVNPNDAPPVVRHLAFEADLVRQKPKSAGRSWLLAEFAAKQHNGCGPRPGEIPIPCIATSVLPSGELIGQIQRTLGFRVLEDNFAQANAKHPKPRKLPQISGEAWDQAVVTVSIGDHISGTILEVDETRILIEMENGLMGRLRKADIPGQPDPREFVKGKTHIEAVVQFVYHAKRRIFLTCNPETIKTIDAASPEAKAVGLDVRKPAGCATEKNWRQFHRPGERIKNAYRSSGSGFSIKSAFEGLNLPGSS